MKMNAITPQNNPLRQMATRQAAPQQDGFAAAVLSTTMQNQITKSVPDERARARFTSAIIELVSSNTALQKCTPASVISAALRGEGQGLILGHGYYVVPYGSKASYITSYRGYISLAMASGLYDDLDCLEVREGEFKGRDRLTGKQTVDFSVYTTDEERESHPIVGYYAYFRLKDGFFRSEYWSMEKLIQHASKYSQAFDAELYKRIEDGTATERELEKAQSGSPWYSSTDRMCKKTVLRSLLNSGFAPLSNEVRNFIANDADYVIPESTPLINAAVSDPLIIDSTAKEKSADPLKIENAPDAREAAQTVEKSLGKEIPTEAVKRAQKAQNTPKTATQKELKQETAPKTAQASLFEA